MYHREKQIQDQAEYVTFCDHLNGWIRIKVALPSQLRYWSVLHASVSNLCLWAWHTNVNLKVKYIQVKIIIRLTKSISSSGKDTTDLQVPMLYVCKLWHFDCIDLLTKYCFLFFLSFTFSGNSFYQLCECGQGIHAIVCRQLTAYIIALWRKTPINTILTKHFMLLPD